MGGVRGRFIVALISCRWRAWCEDSQNAKQQNAEKKWLMMMAIRGGGKNLWENEREMRPSVVLHRTFKHFQGGQGKRLSEGELNVHSLSCLRHCCNKSSEPFSMTSTAGLSPSVSLQREIYMTWFTVVTRCLWFRKIQLTGFSLEQQSLNWCRFHVQAF